MVFVIKLDKITICDYNFLMDYQQNFYFYNLIKEPEQNHYFTENDIIMCPQHVESKKLINKYWNQMNNIGFKIDVMLFYYENNNFDLTSKKIIGLTEKYDKIEKEFNGAMRGLIKCGCC